MVSRWSKVAVAAQNKRLQLERDAPISVRVARRKALVVRARKAKFDWFQGKRLRLLRGVWGPWVRCWRAGGTRPQWVGLRDNFSPEALALAVQQRRSSRTRFSVASAVKAAKAAARPEGARLVVTVTNFEGSAHRALRGVTAGTVAAALRAAGLGRD